MAQRTSIKVPRGSRINPNCLPLSPEAIARRKAEAKAFAQRCQAIFDQVYPELVKDHYDWFIHIEPDSGDYFLDPDEEVCFKKIRQKHPKARIMVMRLNETGSCGRI